MSRKYSTSKRYLGTDGHKYSYEMKYRGYWQFYRMSDKNGMGGGLCTLSESDLERLDLQER